MHINLFFSYVYLFLVTVLFLATPYPYIFNSIAFSIENENNAPQRESLLVNALINRCKETSQDPNDPNYTHPFKFAFAKKLAEFSRATNKPISEIYEEIWTHIQQLGVDSREKNNIKKVLKMLRKLRQSKDEDCTKDPKVLAAVIYTLEWNDIDIKSIVHLLDPAGKLALEKDIETKIKELEIKNYSIAMHYKNLATKTPNIEPVKRSKEEILEHLLSKKDDKGNPETLKSFIEKLKSIFIDKDKDKGEIFKILGNMVYSYIQNDKIIIKEKLKLVLDPYGFSDLELEPLITYVQELSEIEIEKNKKTLESINKIRKSVQPEISIFEIKKELDLKTNSSTISAILLGRRRPNAETLEQINNAVQKIKEERKKNEPNRDNIYNSLMSEKITTYRDFMAELNRNIPNTSKKLKKKLKDIKNSFIPLDKTNIRKNLNDFLRPYDLTTEQIEILTNRMSELAEKEVEKNLELVKPIKEKMHSVFPPITYKEINRKNRLNDNNETVTRIMTGRGNILEEKYNEISKAVEEILVERKKTSQENAELNEKNKTNHENILSHTHPIDLDPKTLESNTPLSLYDTEKGESTYNNDSQQKNTPKVRIIRPAIPKKFGTHKSPKKIPPKKPKFTTEPHTKNKENTPTIVPSPEKVNPSQNMNTIELGSGNLTYAQIKYLIEKNSITIHLDILDLPKEYQKIEIYCGNKKTSIPIPRDNTKNISHTFKFTFVNNNSAALEKKDIQIHFTGENINEYIFSLY